MFVLVLRCALCAVVRYIMAQDFYANGRRARAYETVSLASPIRCLTNLLSAC